MTVEHLLAFNVVLFAAIVSPGPALLVAVQTTLSSGRNAGIATGFGLALIAATWTLLALFGLEAVFRVAPWAYSAAKAIGMAYLLHIAWRMWKGAKDCVELTETPMRNAFLKGVLINATNPKSVLFAAAVLIVIFPENMTVMENAAIVFNHLVIECAFYLALVLCIGGPAARNAYLKAKTYLDRGAALVLGALGLRLAFSAWD